MASIDMCEHDWPGTGCKECKRASTPMTNISVPRPLLERLAEWDQFPHKIKDALSELRALLAQPAALAEPVSGGVVANSEAGMAEWAEGKFGAGGRFTGQLYGNTDWALARLVWSAALESAALNGGAVAERDAKDGEVKKS